MCVLIVMIRIRLKPTCIGGSWQERSVEVPVERVVVQERAVPVEKVVEKVVEKAVPHDVPVDRIVLQDKPVYVDKVHRQRL